MSVGTRPADVWGWAIRPSRSRTDISLRTVAADTPSPAVCVTVCDPTGCALDT